MLPEDMVKCETASMAMKDSTLTYISFVQRDVETFGKGKPYTRMEKFETEVSYDMFVSMFRFVWTDILLYFTFNYDLGKSSTLMLNILLPHGS